MKKSVLIVFACFAVFSLTANELSLSILNRVKVPRAQKIMNKMDKESANPDMVKAQMAEKGMTPVDWGGNTEFIGVSARTGEGIEDLLENILKKYKIRLPKVR